MMTVSRLLIIVSSFICFSLNCTAFESKTFQELAKIQKVTKEIHTYKDRLSIETLVIHDKVASELNGLIDTIIDEVGSDKNVAHEDDFRNLNSSLQELQYNYHKELKPSQELNAYDLARNMRASVAPSIISVILIAGINLIEKEIELWQREKEALKDRRITSLETYKWKLINDEN